LFNWLTFNTFNSFYPSAVSENIYLLVYCPL